MTKRIFVSIDLPNSLKDHLKNHQKSEIRWIKWTKAENLHLTLNFLGYLEEEEIAEAKEILKEAAGNFHPFELKFASLKCEREMLWLIPQENPDLLALQDSLKKKLEETRLLKRERRRYTPHILIGRSKSGRPMRLEIPNLDAQRFLVDKINLYESKLTPGAATHILIESFPLL